MSDPRPYMCRLCLFKSEVADVDENYLESGQELGFLIEELFQEKVKLTKSELDVICSPCRAKLKVFHEYFKFVLGNQDRVLLGEPVPTPEDLLIKEEPLDVEEELDSEEQLRSLTSPGSDKGEVDKDEFRIVDLRSIISNSSEESSNTARGNIGRAHTSTDLQKIRHRSKLTPEKQKFRQDQNNLIRKFFDLKCRLCPQMPPYDDFTKLAYHMDKFHGAKLEVPCCGKSFTTKFLYWQHLVKRHTLDYTQRHHFDCSECSGTYSTSWKLKVHRYLAHHYCDLCEAKMKNVKGRPSLRSHLQQHAFSKDPKHLAPFVCHHCSKEFGDRERLKLHLTSKHVERMTIVCPKCGLEFKTKASLAMHHLRQHETTSPRVACPVCSVAIKQIYLEEHVKNAHEVHPTPCDVCQQVFNSRKFMRAHVISKHGPGKWQCRFCDKKLVQKKALREHEAVHLGISLYKCNICQAEFKSSGNYNAHRRKLHPIEHAVSKARNVAKKYEL